MSGVSMSTVFTMVLPAYTTAAPVTSTTATVVEQAFKNTEIRMIDNSLFIYFLFFHNSVNPSFSFSNCLTPRFSKTKLRYLRLPDKSMLAMYLSSHSNLCCSEYVFSNKSIFNHLNSFANPIHYRNCH